METSVEHAVLERPTTAVAPFVADPQPQTPPHPIAPALDADRGTSPARGVRPPHRNCRLGRRRYQFSELCRCAGSVGNVTAGLAIVDGFGLETTHTSSGRSRACAKVVRGRRAIKPNSKAQSAATKRVPWRQFAEGPPVETTRRAVGCVGNDD